MQGRYQHMQKKIQNIKGNAKEKTQMKWGYFFIAPAIIGLICFSFGPMLFSLGVSFTKWDVISEKQFVGLENYIMLFQDPLFLQSLKRM